MIEKIRKRDGRVEKFAPEKITSAIFKAAAACGGNDLALAQRLCDKVVELAEVRYQGKIPEVEQIQDLVEYVLIENGHAKTAKAYILYREKRKSARELNALIGATINMFGDYLGDKDWKVQENANAQKSVNGLNNYIREIFTKNYWLHEIYPTEVREAHESGDCHIHDLGFFGAYCAGWDLRQLLLDGFGGVPGKVESKPAKHLRSFLGQIVNSTFTTQGELAGAQAWSSFDTYCAPFIRYDNLSYEQVKQCIQEFIFNINVPTRVGFQCPFSNLTFDIKVPNTLKDEHVIIGGQYTNDKYGDFQAEMDMLNRAFCEVMLEGDAKGRVFTFPIPTLNITRDFDWDSPAVEGFMKITCKYGIPYFANYVNSDLSPEDAVSMCCRLRLDTSELRKRGGGLFGSNPMTGSIGVFTINLPRIGYLSSTKEEFKERLYKIAQIGKTSLEIKRKIIEQQSERGLYPYSCHYLRNIKMRTGSYWYNHFSTIGIVGMNEALLNFMGKDITTPEGQEFAIEIMNFLRDIMVEFQKETGNFYNLEATPAEGASYRLAKLDKERYPDIITAGNDICYYTNSTQLPVGFTDDIFECLDLQDELQSLYTGGTVQHLYLGESISDVNVCKNLIRRIFENYKMPYISITPTFSICNTHGYISGEHFTCPECGQETEVWSRVTGYLRPVANYNKGKKEEYANRKKFVLKTQAS
ncbi:MAG TPA: ribonucleoside triphosphate reductase [Thermoclostridium caenicola]|uniref:ribonucleoside triphosphate reductase n=1 Tax=Thermoclostridium caenicola TaxID=659425 RepID=UPI002C9F5D74|nr:ribonucleoside triphosphate reductase [Thermoclostridium caenicola]HOL84287.1 ribonucleoside triphosphate reductase [Thermoclostridium caenicola]HPO76268.1 ribonucleoside triphosphate reductase [Thermoclostridium caenicola]